MAHSVIIRECTARRLYIYASSYLKIQASVVVSWVGLAIVGGIKPALHKSENSCRHTEITNDNYMDQTEKFAFQWHRGLWLIHFHNFMQTLYYFTISRAVNSCDWPLNVARTFHSASKFFGFLTALSSFDFKKAIFYSPFCKIYLMSLISAEIFKVSTGQLPSSHCWEAQSIYRFPRELRY